MFRITCVRKFVDPMEVGTVDYFSSIASAEKHLGRYFLDNCCEVIEINAPTNPGESCGQPGCSICDPQNETD